MAKSCGSEAKWVNALILDKFKILLSPQNEGEKGGTKKSSIKLFTKKPQNNSTFCDPLMPRAQANL